MKKALLLCGLLVLFAMSAGDLLAQSYSVIVTTKQANIREAPGATEKVVGRVRQGTVVKTSSNNGSWYYVTHGNLRGWMHYTTLRKPEERELTGSKTAKRSSSKDYASVYKDEWIKYESSTTSHEYYNPAKMSRQGTIVSVWTRSRDKTTYDLSQIVLFQIECGTPARMRAIAGVKYYPSGAVSSSYDNPRAGWSVVIPGTVGETLRKDVCEAAN